MVKEDDQKLQMFREFRYLEFTLTRDKNITIEMKQRILMVIRASDGLKKQLRIFTVTDKMYSI
jgi:hypothetical protein